MNKKTVMILSVILIYLVFVFDFNLKVTRKDSIHTVNYNGVLWVFLDMYSNESTKNKATSLQWIKYTRKKIN